MKLNKHILASVLVGALATPALTSCSDFLDENLTTERNTDFLTPMKAYSHWQPLFTITFVPSFFRMGILYYKLWNRRVHSRKRWQQRHVG